MPYNPPFKVGAIDDGVGAVRFTAGVALAGRVTEDFKRCKR
jgi:hypothetical protein